MNEMPGVAGRPGNLQRPSTRIASWNLWWRFGDWRYRQEAITKTLADLNADIAGFQEIWASNGSTQASVLANTFGFYSAFGGPSLPPTPASPDRKNADLGVAIISRWPIRHAWIHQLPSSRPQPPVALLAAHRQITMQSWPTSPCSRVH